MTQLGSQSRQGGSLLGQRPYRQAQGGIGSSIAAAVEAVVMLPAPQLLSRRRRSHDLRIARKS
ncbi:hypothetical protein OHT20_03445 [Streptomyces caniferus]|uniref:Uncharacterized protein n=1 Tax=Streptomyces caniferus TaxID=285557 RepID=A0ABZ1VZL7_9ACTN|nr:hypothetical protein [Streptomyces caniferus]